MQTEQTLGPAKRVLIKIGTQVLTDAQGKLDLNMLRDLCEQAARLRAQGKDVIIVSSGAIGAGRARLEVNGDKSLPMQQACAAVGQAILMEHYNSFLGRLGRNSAQVLLTNEDLKDGARRKNLMSAFDTLLRLDVIPIVNENDTVSVSELDPSEGKDASRFGDNDMLSALLAADLKADLLCILSCVDGLMDEKGQVVAQAQPLDGHLDALDNGSRTGRGGLPTKLKALRHASSHGVACVLANGKTSGILTRLAAGERLGTYFPASPTSASGTDGAYAAQMARQAKDASVGLARTSLAQRRQALEAMAVEIEQHAPTILEQNAKDVHGAQEKRLSPAIIQRLKLDQKKVQALAKTLRTIAALEQPSEPLRAWKLANGLDIRQVRTPLGALLLIFESRPDVAVEAGALAILSGNALVLKGGKEARHSNAAISALLQTGASHAGLPAHTIQVFEQSREELAQLLGHDESFELVVARGGEGLIRMVQTTSRIPVMCAGGGNCHLYVHEDADLDMALSIALNAKVQKPSACNAIEKVLVHEKAAAKFLPMLAKKMDEQKVELRGCARTLKLLAPLSFAGLAPAAESDWGTEYLDLILAVKVVDTLEEAISHINRWGSRHSECIICRDPEASAQFAQAVDAAVVYHNASTRFSDGGQFGFGGEVCISTQKLHARGPVGSEGLRTYKYLVEGTGQVREG